MHARRYVPSHPADPLAVVDDHLAAQRLRIQRAGNAVSVAARGRLLRYGAGFDPEGHANRAWWARAEVNVGRYPGQRITVDGFATGVEALEALAETVDEFMAAHNVAPVR